MNIETIRLDITTSLKALKPQVKAFLTHTCCDKNNAIVNLRVQLDKSYLLFEEARRLVPILNTNILNSDQMWRVLKLKKIGEKWRTEFIYNRLSCYKSKSRE